MKVHFLGIGGSGASAAAALAEAQGFEVTGCDLEPNNEFTTQFKSSQLLKDHNPKHFGFHPKGAGSNIDILAVTPAIFSLDPDNPELVEAKKIDIPILTWQQFLGEYLTKGKFVITVCGTHGKTTTTAMIAKLLEDAGLDPTVELGAIVPWWKTNYKVGQGKYFVVEADEFNDNFLHLKPDINVVTDIEMDHPEYFKDLEAVKESFKKFLLQTKGTVVGNLKDKGVSVVLKDVMKQSKVACFDYSNKQSLPFSFPSKGNHYNLKLTIPGEFNQLNAAAAFQVGLLLNIDTTVIRKSLESYPGVGRRFEYIGEYKGAKVYSDFGHHPTEIKVTMKAVREKFPGSRILLIYQPHMFSRTKVLFNDFVKVFKEIPVDRVTILDIYPSREVDTGLVNSQELVATIGGKNVTHSKWDDLKNELATLATKNDILFFMGAGDIDKMARKFIR